MRKLKLEVQLSLDGFAADIQGNTDWMVWHWQRAWNWDKNLQDFHTQLQLSCDTLLMSKKMARGDFFKHWQQIADDKKNLQSKFANAILNMKRYVLSRKLAKSPWENIKLLNGDLQKEVTKLKRQQGKDMIVYGGTSFVSSLIKEDLVDEYNLVINPIILGKGKPIFSKISHLRNLTLEGASHFDCGVVLLKYVKVSR